MRVFVDVVKSTARAHLVKDDEGRMGWVQSKWLRDDSTVSMYTFERAVESFESKEIFDDTARKEKNSFFAIGDTVRETEKAIAVSAIIEEEHTDQVLMRTVWLPKSQLKDGRAAGWLLEAKAKELMKDLSAHGGCFSVRIGDYSHA